MKALGSRFSLATVASVLAAIAVVASLWYPEFAHYYKATPRLSPAAVEAARQTPDDALLRELAEFSPAFLAWKQIAALSDPMPSATALLQGVVDIAGLPKRHITMPFAVNDVVQGSTDWQLAVAGLGLPALLMRAYEQTGDDRFLLAARDMILGWASFERQAWLPRGFLWNDHATAARMPVLAEFWLRYRRHPSYDAAVGARVLEFAARTAAFLADPSHFTVSTNHGVMQNLGLWHYALAFPTLPNTTRSRQIALERLTEQLGFYVNDEGVVLEQSAGYHRDGLELFGMALRYLTLAGESPRPEWTEKYRRAVRVYTQLRLPLGELPTFGDTPVEPDVAGPRITRILPDGRVDILGYPPTWPSPAPWTLYPVAGYAVGWSGVTPEGRAPDRRSQTVVAWAYFPGHGHKHADEMSLLLWAWGRSWIGNVGYWPYEATGYVQAASWAGSNAPHLATEPASSARVTRLLSATRTERVGLIDLERAGPGGYRARRQIVQLGPDLWIVVDHAAGRPDGINQVQWTAAAGAHLRPTGVAGLYRLQPDAGGLSMVLGVASSPGATVRQLHGSLDPFGGWQVIRWTPTPVDSLLIEQPAGDSWTITTWCLQDDAAAGRGCPARPISARFVRDDDWSVTVPRLPVPITLRRTGGVLEGDGLAGSGPSRVALEAAPDVAGPRAAIRAALESAIRHYPRFRELGYYRLRATYALLVAFVLQELTFAVVVPRGTPRRVLRWASVVAWLGVGVWLTRVYLA